MFPNLLRASALLGLLGMAAAIPNPAGADLRTLETRDGAGSKVFLGYWSVWAGNLKKELPTADHLKGLTHVVLSFMNNETVYTTGGVAPPTGKGFLASSTNDWGTDIVAKMRTAAGNPNLKVMAAMGGWALEETFNKAVRGGQKDAFVLYCKNFVEAYKLDGIDMDWEYPVHGGEFDTTEHPDDVQGFIDLLVALRAAIPAPKLLTVAVGAKAEGLKAFKADTTPIMEKSIDFWNVMSYDYNNRRDGKSGFHASGTVMETVFADLKTRGFSPAKMVLGYPMYAKWFQLTPAQAAKCSPTASIGCEMGPYEGPGALLSGVWNWNAPLNVPPITATLHTPSTQLGEWAAGNMTDWNAFDDKTALGSATVDLKNNVFWTWMTPYDIENVCKKWHSQVLGTFYWSIYEDSEGAAGGPHVRALQSCVGGA